MSGVPLRRTLVLAEDRMANKQLNPVMVNLDMILMSTEWETRHPLYYAWSNARVGSDHWPIFLDSREKLVGQTKHFYLKKQ
jgi:endonuclease/exonuclease/phosphatase family metal-dependent hydrolase